MAPAAQKPKADGLTRQDLIMSSINYELAEIYFPMFVVQLQKQVIDVGNRKHRADYQMMNRNGG